MPRYQLISSEAEKERYDQHENNESDSSYATYLSTISSFIHSQLSSSQTGLDFGSGRTTLLSDQLTSLGHRMSSYDAYFLLDESIWNQKFDFIVLSEVIEHLRDPQDEMLKLNALLNPNGRFFIKTKLRPDALDEFEKWFYKRDITHIQFFHSVSMEYLRSHLRREILGLH